MNVYIYIYLYIYIYIYVYEVKLFLYRFYVINHMKSYTFFFLNMQGNKGNKSILFVYRNIFLQFLLYHCTK